MVESGVDVEKWHLNTGFWSPPPTLPLRIPPHLTPRSLFPRSPTDSARFTIVVKKNAADVYFGDDMIREVKWFGPTRHGNADESECPKDVFVGIMACSPLKGGANVTFREFTEKEGARGQ